MSSRLVVEAGLSLLIKSTDNAAPLDNPDSAALRHDLLTLQQVLQAWDATAPVLGPARGGRATPARP